MYDLQEIFQIDFPSRYLKNVYPSAEETFLLDLLSGCDNNVQEASERLSELGYAKRDTPVPGSKSLAKKDKPSDVISPMSKIISEDDKRTSE